MSFFLSTSISVWLRHLLVSDFSILGFGLFVCLFVCFFCFFLRIREFDLLIDVGLFFPGGLALLHFFLLA